eukprot:Sro1862_g302260.2  (523) ;mRNA; r:17313-18881
MDEYIQQRRGNSTDSDATGQHEQETVAVVQSSSLTTTSNNDTVITPVDQFQLPPPTAGATVALLRALKRAKVQFLRLAVVDVSNAVRCKAKPLSSLASTTNHDHDSINPQVAIAKVCFAGMPRYADVPVAASNLTATGSLMVKPDWNTLRILPYAPATALCLGFAYDTQQQQQQQQQQQLSPYCTRGLLARLVQAAREQLGLVFDIGAELEFQLYHTTTFTPVDGSLFADSVTLNEQEPFLVDLLQQLQEQDIPVELVHAESANGQLEVVLQHQPDPLALADAVVLARETIRAVAKYRHMKAVFLPKTNPMAAGSGCHLHFSFLEAEQEQQGTTTTTCTKNGFPCDSSTHEDSYLSPRAGSFLEGILRHMPALLALTMPSVNSFRRVGPGCWTGHDVRWDVEDKEAPIRLCLEGGQPQKATHAEFKLVDSTCNLYMAMTGLLAAGMQGMRQGLTLRPPGNDNQETLPKTLPESLDALDADSYLKSVLGEELSTAYLAVKRDEAKHYADKTILEDLAEALGKA